MTLVRWPLICGLLHLVQRRGAWAGPHPSTASVPVTVLLRMRCSLFSCCSSRRILESSSSTQFRWKMRRRSVVLNSIGNTRTGRIVLRLAAEVHTYIHEIHADRCFDTVWPSVFLLLPLCFFWFLHSNVARGALTWSQFLHFCSFISVVELF